MFSVNLLQKKEDLLHKKNNYSKKRIIDEEWRQTKDYSKIRINDEEWRQTKNSSKIRISRLNWRQMPPLLHVNLRILLKSTTPYPPLNKTYKMENPHTIIG